MASNLLYYSKLNPVKLVEVAPIMQPQYMSFYDEDYRSADILRDYQTEVQYWQKWTVADVIKFQFTSNFGGIQAQLMTCDGLTTVTTVVADYKKADKFNPGFYIYELSMSLATVSAGYYYLLVTFGGTKQMWSEPFQVLNFLPGSLLFEYANSEFHADMFFETGFLPSFRVEGVVNYDAPATNRTSYIDQKYDPVTLQGIPFQGATVVVGHQYGAPIWVAQKLNYIFSCDNVSIDGKPWGIGEDTKIEAQELDIQYPLKSYSIKVQEGINRHSKIVGVDIDPNKRLLMSLALDSTIFGDIAGAGDSVIQINTLG